MLVFMHPCMRNHFIAIINYGITLVIAIRCMFFESNRAVAKAAKFIIKKSIDRACVKNMIVGGK